LFTSMGPETAKLRGPMRTVRVGLLYCLLFRENI